MKKLIIYTFCFFILALELNFSQKYLDVSTLPFVLGESPGDKFGRSKNAGDVNGDGFDDIVIVAHYDDENGTDAGKVYLYFGGTNFDMTADLVFFGEAAGDLFGRVSSAGDCNADGYDDLIIGSPWNSVNGNNSGRAYIYFGGQNMDNIADIIISGNAGDLLCIVSNAGDLNGDEIDDIMVGTSHTSNLGYVNIYFGGENIDNQPELVLYGESTQDRFGSYISSAGDVNSDGYDDLIVSGHRNSSGGSIAGRAYLYFGGQTMNNVPDLVMTAGESSGYFGWGLSGVGDVNNDGFDDVIIGAKAQDAGGHDNGKAYLYYGSENMDNIADAVFIGKQYEEGFSEVISSAGDFNNDNFDDFIIGTRGKGKAYMYFGGENIIDQPNIIFNDEKDGDGLGYANTAVDINGDGRIDIIIAAELNDDNGTDAGKAYFYISERIPNGLVAYYLFNGNANDESGNGFNGAVNGPIPTIDRNSEIDKAYHFDGTDDYIEVGENVNLQISGDLTISGWLNVNNFSKSNQGIVICQKDNTDNPGTNALYVLHFKNPNNYISYLHESGDGVDQIVDFSNFIFKIGEWYHVVLTRNVGEKRLDLHVNGKLVDSRIYELNPSNGYLSPLVIGEFRGTVINDRFFDGKLDDIGIYNVVLTENEIMSLYGPSTPIITEQPINKIVDEGQTALFNISASCNDSIGYQWWRYPYVSSEESKIFDIPGRIEGATTNVLKILNTTVDDDNNTQFLCEVYNSFDHQNLWINSETVALNVNTSDQIITLNISADSVWYDNNYDGVQLGMVDASSSSVNIGNITSYVWTLYGDTVGYGVSPTIELATGTNELLLTVRTDQGNLKQVIKNINMYAAKLETNGPLFSSVSWLDNKSLFVSSTDDKIYKFDSTGTVAWNIITGGSILSTICVSDENNIYAASTDTRLYAFDNNGAPRWDKAMGGVVTSSPSVGPDNSIFVGLNNGRLFSMTEAGNLSWSMQTDGAIVSSPAISGNRVYFGSSDKKVYCVSSTTGEIINTYTTDDSLLSSPAIGKDGSVIIGSNDGYIYKFDSELNLIWKYYTLGQVTSSPVIDEIGDIYVGSSSGFIYALSAEKILLWKYNVGVPVNGNPSLGPNGLLYIGCDDGKLLVLSRSGTLLWYLQTDEPIKASALISPNNIIYLASLDGNVYILKDPSTGIGDAKLNLSFEWPTFKGNNERTGYISKELTHVSQEDTFVPSKFKLSQNYPNPFNPATVINYSIPKACFVTLKVYDVLGKEVTELVNKEQAVGDYRLSVDADKLMSGIYFYRIQAGDFVATMKMILMK